MRRLALAALVVALLPVPARADEYVPSQPTYSVVAETDQYVEMDDGTQVQVDVYRPDAPGRFPAIVWFDVYYKDDPTGPVVNSERDYFVTRGYVFVHASSPGSNNSGGTYDNAFSTLEQEAATAVVEWSGEQSWSTGKVGMDGLSYAAIIQYFVGARRPEHLVTLYPAAAYSDLYREIAYIGGNFQSGYPIGWDVANRSYAYLPPFTDGGDPASAYGNWAQNVAGWRPIAPDYATRPHDGPFYRERSPRWTNDEIAVPFALDVGWRDDMLYGGPINFETVGSAHKRLVIGPWGHSQTHRREGGRFERLRWYDYYLKGLPSGVTEDPPVRVHISEGGDASSGRWVAADQWPLPGTSIEELYLGPEGTLGASGSGSASYRYLPGRQELWEGIAFETAPLDESLEVVGYPELVLHASSSAPDTSFAVRVFDVASDGSRTSLQHGWLRASLRKVDPALSQPGRPHHTFDTDELLEPGEIYEYRIPIWPFANRFPAGHRIRIEVNDRAIGPSGTPFVGAPFPGENTIHFGPETPSRLVLPTVS